MNDYGHDGVAVVPNAKYMSKSGLNSGRNNVLQPKLIMGTKNTSTNQEGVSTNVLGDNLSHGAKKTLPVIKSSAGTKSVLKEQSTVAQPRVITSMFHDSSDSSSSPVNVVIKHPQKSRRPLCKSKVEVDKGDKVDMAMLRAVTPIKNTPKVTRLPPMSERYEEGRPNDNEEPEDVTVLESQRKGIIFYYRGYLHNRKGKELADGSYAAQCIDYGRGCKGRARFLPVGNFVHWVREHNHEPKEHALAIALHNNRVRNIVRVGVASMKPTHVIMAANSQLSMEELVNGPRDASLARRVERQKLKVDGVAVKNAPPTLDKVPYSIDPRFASIDWSPSKPGSRTENTLLIDDGFGRDGNRPRIMGQLSQSGISLISKGRHFAGDGTCAIAPYVFTQVYTLQVFVGAKFRAVPVAVFYLPNKTKRTYMRMFALLKQLVFDVTGIELIMESLIIDFEAAVDIAATMIWTDIKIFYCLSHLSKSVYERVKSENLEDDYINDADFRKSARHLVSLAFLPPEDVVNVFQQIQWHPLIVGIVSGWFEPYYIGSVILGVRQPPMFAISKWNVHSRVLAGQPRSNNALEGLNIKLMTVVGRSHSTIFVTLSAIAGFLRQVHVDEMHIKHGKHKRGTRKLYVQTDAQIATVVNDYLMGDVYEDAVEFLGAMNHIVNMGGFVEKAIQVAEQRDIDVNAAVAAIADTSNVDADDVDADDVNTDDVDAAADVATADVPSVASPDQEASDDKLSIATLRQSSTSTPSPSRPSTSTAELSTSTMQPFISVGHVGPFVGTLQTRRSEIYEADIHSNDSEFLKHYNAELRDKKKTVVQCMPVMVLSKSNAMVNGDMNKSNAVQAKETINGLIDGVTDVVLDDRSNQTMDSFAEMNE